MKIGIMSAMMRRQLKSEMDMRDWSDDSGSEEFDIEISSMDSEDERFVFLEKTPEFLELCRIARNLDENALRRLNAIDTDLYIEDDDGRMVNSPDGISPTYQEPLVEQMIKEGNDEAIAMLISEIKIKRFVICRAIEAYFDADKLDKVEELLTAHPKKDYQRLALAHYARHGITEKVDGLLTIEPSWLQDAQFGYAAYGHAQQAESMLTRGGTKEQLISGYAAGSHFNKLNQWIESKSTNQRRSNRIAALSGLRDGGIIKNETRLLKALSHIDSNATRVFLMNQPAITFRKLNKAYLLNESKRLNHIMRSYDMTYEQAEHAARVLAKSGVREWFLQARQQGTVFANLPHNLLITLAMKVTNMSYQDTEALYLAVCRNTHDGAQKISQNTNSMFAKNKKTNHKREREPGKIDRLYDTKMRRLGN